MSCRNGEDCREPQKRFRALFMLGLMAAIFIVLSVISFVGSRDQAVPAAFALGEHQATAGKRVFQAYNCMGCHTIVGNGAYFGPDLTNVYEQAGPAWLAAFLPSAGQWPTEAAVKVQLADPMIAEAAGAATIDAYYDKYPGAAIRVNRRGGGTTLMPSLTFDKAEIYRLIAFFAYTAAMDTEGWPPKVKVDGLEHRIRLAHGANPAAALTQVSMAAPAQPSSAQSTQPAAASVTGEDLVKTGEQLVTEYGCTACHSTTTKRIVGPGWGSAFGATITLDDGGTATIDEAYLAESIRQPGAAARKGYPQGVMPAYGRELISDADLDAIVAYLRSLEK